MKISEVNNNKSLKLINVLIKEISTEELSSQEIIILAMRNYIYSLGNEIIGPIIFYSTGITDYIGNNPVIKTKIFIQVKQPINKLDNTNYSFKKEYKVSNCLMVKYQEHMNNLHFAGSKITLFAFENGLKLTGESYSLVLKQDKENNLEVDLFMPLEMIL